MISQHADDVIVLWITYSVKIDRQAVQRHCWLYVFRHSQLPAGNALWFCQIFYFIFLFFYLFLIFFFRRQGFRMITFDRQAGPLQNFNRSHVMVIGRSVSFSDPARPPSGGVGCRRGSRGVGKRYTSSYDHDM